MDMQVRVHMHARPLRVQDRAWVGRGVRLEMGVRLELGLALTYAAMFQYRTPKSLRILVSNLAKR